MSTKEIPKPPKVVVAPKGCREWLTEGKEYNVVKTGLYARPGGHSFEIMDDDGDMIGCIENGCSHINNRNWIIKEREA